MKILDGIAWSSVEYNLPAPGAPVMVASRASGSPFLAVAYIDEVDTPGAVGKAVTWLGSNGAALPFKPQFWARLVQLPV